MWQEGDGGEAELYGKEEGLYRGEEAGKCTGKNLDSEDLGRSEAISNYTHAS